jgi:hypothetical protein
MSAVDEQIRKLKCKIKNLELKSHKKTYDQLNPAETIISDKLILGIAMTNACLPIKTKSLLSQLKFLIETFEMNDDQRKSMIAFYNCCCEGSGKQFHTKVKNKICEFRKKFFTKVMVSIWIDSSDSTTKSLRTVSNVHFKMREFDDEIRLEMDDFHMILDSLISTLDYEDFSFGADRPHQTDSQFSKVFYLPSTLPFYLFLWFVQENFENEMKFIYDSIKDRELVLKHVLPAAVSSVDELLSHERKTRENSEEKQNRCLSIFILQGWHVDCLYCSNDPT